MHGSAEAYCEVQNKTSALTEPGRCFDEIRFISSQTVPRIP